MGRALAFVMVLIVGLSSLASGGGNSDMRVAVHVMAHDPKRACENGIPEIEVCGDIVTTYAGHDVDCFPVFYDLVEYRGCEYGLSWPGTYTCVFTSCSDLVIGDIVEPGDGASHVWTDCRNGHAMIPGWAWIYEPGSAAICVVEHPTSNKVLSLDCNEGVDDPAFDPVCAGIGGTAGGNACYGYVSEDQTTWGSVKTLFR